MFERMIFELVFPQSDFMDSETRVCTESAENVLDGIKGVAVRDMDKRRRLYKYLYDKLTEGGAASELDEEISQEEWALFMQGVFFTTGVVQLSEGMAHIAMALAQHPHVVQKLRANPQDNVYLNHV